MKSKCNPYSMEVTFTVYNNGVGGLSATLRSTYHRPLFTRINQFICAIHRIQSKFILQKKLHAEKYPRPPEQNRNKIDTTIE